MSATATKGAGGLGGRVLQQLAAPAADDRNEVVEVAALRARENHTSTTIIERIGNARRGYLAWLALQTSSITGREPPIDGDADASWRAR